MMLPARRAKQKCQEASRRRKTRNNLGHADTSFERDKPTDCSICLETVSIRGKLGVCNHWFCFQCIYEWSKMTNTCPLCKLRFRCITKTNLEPWASPPKQFRIKDKDQNLNLTTEDEEVAEALENETSSEEEHSDFSEASQSRPLDAINSPFTHSEYEEDSFIDDSDLSQGPGNSSLRTYLQRADDLMRSPYAFRRGRRNLQRTASVSASYPTRRSNRLNVPQRFSDESQSVKSDENYQEARPTVGRRRKRRHPLNCPETRRSLRSSSRPSSTVRGWINMADKQSNLQRGASITAASLRGAATIARNSSRKSPSEEDSDSSQDGILLPRKQKKTVKIISTDEENEDSDATIDSNLDLFESERSMEQMSPAVVSSQTSSDAGSTEQRTGKQQTTGSWSSWTERNAIRRPSERDCKKRIMGEFSRPFEAPGSSIFRLRQDEHENANDRTERSSRNATKLLRGDVSASSKENLVVDYRNKTSFEPRKPLHSFVENTNLLTISENDGFTGSSFGRAANRDNSKYMANSLANKNTFKEYNSDSSTDVANSTTNEDSTYFPDSNVLSPTPERKPRFRKISRRKSHARTLMHDL